MVDSANVSTSSRGGSLPVADPTPVQIRGEGLTIDQVVRVARRRAPVAIADDPEIRRRIEASLRYVLDAAASADRIYGVTTGFGGMANVVIAPEDAGALQENIARFMSTGAGRPLAIEDVRAAMLLRANSHVRGASGLRYELIRRLVVFLNEGVTPRILEFGSIGASGDLTPLSQVMGAVCGLSPSFLVDHRGETVDCLTALARLGLEPLAPGPKEGLAMVNGTSVMTGVAANCVHDARTVTAIALGTQALYIQALRGTNQSFHPFIHQHKPHPGQVLAARLMLRLLEGSAMVRDELDGRHEDRGGEPIQDRYSLRCLPQYTGPILDGLEAVGRQIETEINSATDNPLIDGDQQRSYHGGNFLGQYVGVAMDQLRYLLGLLIKHLDVQIALLMAPEFNQGLPPSLVGNQGRKVNMGLKGLQISGNSIMPVIGFLGGSLVDRFPTHAEQFNQNVNSLGLGSAVLARQSLDAAFQYLGVALLAAVQAADLRTYANTGSYDARRQLSAATVPLYEAVRSVVGKAPSAERPYVWDDRDQVLAEHIALVAADIAGGGAVPAAVEGLVSELR